MQIKVLKTTKAANCPLGINSKEYLKDETYDIFDELAKVFIREGWGKATEDKKDEDGELKTLREKAKELKIKSSHMMGINKLKEAIKDEEAIREGWGKATEDKKDEDGKKDEKALPALENKAITNIENK